MKKYRLTKIKKSSKKVRHIRKPYEDIPNLEKIYARLKSTEGRLAEAEKFRAIAQLASGMAHEIRNPLAVLLQCLDYLEQKAPRLDNDVRGTLTVMKNNIDRANKIISIVHQFSEGGQASLKAEDANSILEDAIASASRDNDTSGIEIAREMRGGIPKILVDRSRIEQVFINLITNAFQAMPKGGTLTVRTYENVQKKAKGFRVGSRKDDLFRDNEKAVIVEIQDTGVGICEDKLKKISVPFYTTFDSKMIGKGPGLGLSLSKSIVDFHRGMIDIASKPGEGTKVTITLHVAD